jgi:hypothetical protein
VIGLGGKVFPSNCVMPTGVAPVVVLHDLGRIFDQLTAEEAVVVFRQPRWLLPGRVPSHARNWLNASRHDERDRASRSTGSAAARLTDPGNRGSGDALETQQSTELPWFGSSPSLTHPAYQVSW